MEGGTAELDYLTALENPTTGNEMIGIEVKSGTAGTLRSLHQFVAESKVKRAVRISSAPLNSVLFGTSNRRTIEFFIRTLNLTVILQNREIVTGD